MEDYPVYTTPNHQPPKIDVLPKTFLQIILAAKFHCAAFKYLYVPKKQRRPQPFLLSVSSSTMTSIKQCSLPFPPIYVHISPVCAPRFQEDKLAYKLYVLHKGEPIVTNLKSETNLQKSFLTFFVWKQVISQKI